MQHVEGISQQGGTALQQSCAMEQHSNCRSQHSNPFWQQFGFVLVLQQFKAASQHFRLRSQQFWLVVCEFVEAASKIPDDNRVVVKICVNMVILQFVNYIEDLTD